jgi:hypothetical protein
MKYKPARTEVISPEPEARVQKKVTSLNVQEERLETKETEEMLISMESAQNERTHKSNERGNVLPTF